MTVEELIVELGKHPPDWTAVAKVDYFEYDDSFTESGQLYSVDRGHGSTVVLWVG